MSRCLCLIVLLLVASLVESPAASQKTQTPRVGTPAVSALPRPADPSASDAQPAARVVSYHARDVARVKTKLRYTTLIVLPKDEVILDFVCGDKDVWVINGDQNFAYVKPAKENSETNLNLITESGNVYSFVLTEISGAAGDPDLKVYVELKDPSMADPSTAPRRFVPARELEDTRQQAHIAQEEARRTKENADAAIDAGISRFVTNVRFAYRFEAGKRPFYVRAMYHDDRFTYIQARPEETPTLYEMKDGKPNLVNFEYRNGVYVVGKILDEGYLAVGREKLAFSREE